MALRRTRRRSRWNDSDEDEYYEYLHGRLIDNHGYGQLPLGGRRRSRSLCLSAIGRDASTEIRLPLDIGIPTVFDDSPDPLGCVAVFARFIADVLHAAEDGDDFAANAALLRAALTGEAFSVSEAPVDDQLGQPRPVDRPFPG